MEICNTGRINIPFRTTMYEWSGKDDLILKRTVDKTLVQELTNH